MNIFIISSVWILSVLINVTKSDFTPSVAFYENLPAMYKTDNGWVINLKNRNELPNATDIVNFCKEIYPDRNISNASPLFKKEIITNWCKINQSCSSENQYEVNPIECLSSSDQSRPMKVSSYCVFGMENKEGCSSFEKLEEIAKLKCRNNDTKLHDFQVIFPCEHSYMQFNEMEYACCPDKGEIGQFSINLQTKLKDLFRNYTSVYNEYQKNRISHFEDEFFSNTKNYLLKTCNNSLNLLYSDLFKDLKEMMHKDGDLDEKKLFAKFKINFEALIHKFNNKITDLDNTHIKRMIRQSLEACHKKNAVNSSITQCLKELRSISKKIIDHSHRMLIIDILKRSDYLSFIEARLKQLYMKYLTITNESQNWTKIFDDQLNEYIVELKALKITEFNSQEYIASKFKSYKDKVLVYIHDRGHNLSFATIISVIAILSFIALAILSLLSYKYCGYRFRRGSHNYVMRVVRDSDQPSHSINHTDVKLNLYENPVFNIKSVPRDIEKQLLIEHMES